MLLIVHGKTIKKLNHEKDSQKNLHQARCAIPRSGGCHGCSMHFRLGSYASMPNSRESIVREDKALTPRLSDSAGPEARQLLRAALARGETIVLRNTGTSMQPCLMPGDILTITPCCNQTPKRGDIVLIDTGEEWIVHRLLGFKGKTKQPLTAGDAATRLDEPLPPESIIGMVTRIKRNSHECPTPTQPAAHARAALRLIRIQTKTAAAAFYRQHSGINSSAANQTRLLLAWSTSGAVPQPVVKDWNAFFAQAEQHGLAPLIYYHARASERQTIIPDAVWHRLDRAYHETLARNTLFLDRLNVFIRAMHARPVLILKGACLARGIYATPALRPFSDLDLLIQRADFSKACRLLVSLGYTPLGNIPQQANMDDAGLNSILFQNAPHTPAFHLHWHLFNSTLPKYAQTNMNIEELWRSAVVSTEGGLHLCTEHLLIHLCEHALRHSYDRLILLRDLAETILQAGNSINWDRLFADTRDFGLARPVHLSLALASELSGATVPGSVLSGLRPRTRGLGERLLLHAIRRGKCYPECSNLVYLADQPGLRSKLAFIMQLLVPPRSTMMRAYGLPPERIGAVFYFKRMLRGLAQVMRGFRLMPKHRANDPQKQD